MVYWDIVWLVRCADARGKPKQQLGWRCSWRLGLAHVQIDGKFHRPDKVTIKLRNKVSVACSSYAHVPGVARQRPKCTIERMQRVGCQHTD